MLLIVVELMHAIIRCWEYRISSDLRSQATFGPLSNTVGDYVWKVWCRMLFAILQFLLIYIFVSWISFSFFLFCFVLFYFHFHSWVLHFILLSLSPVCLLFDVLPFSSLVYFALWYHLFCQRLFTQWLVLVKSGIQVEQHNTLLCCVLYLQ